ncbi:MAG: hypothetical protein ACI9R3_002473 [Verrucomicrobiales bacterium]|jgi:hypothetical protein
MICLQLSILTSGVWFVSLLGHDGMIILEWRFLADLLHRRKVHDEGTMPFGP